MSLVPRFERQDMSSWAHLSKADAKICAQFRALGPDGKKDIDKQNHLFLKVANSGRSQLMDEVLKGARWYKAGMIAAMIDVVKKRDNAMMQVLVERVGRNDYSDIEDSKTLLSWAGYYDSPCMPSLIGMLSDLKLERVLSEVKRLVVPEIFEESMQALLKQRVKLNDQVEILLASAERDSGVFKAVEKNLTGSQAAMVRGQIFAAIVSKGAESARGLCNYLMERDINVNCNDGALMTGVLSRGWTDMAEQLIDKGYELPLWGERVLKDVHSAGAPVQAIEWLRKKTNHAAAEEGYSLMAPDTVSRVLALPDGGSLSLLFNFTTRQQIVLHQSAAAQAGAPAVIDFSAIHGEGVLASAAQALIDHGGERALALPFVGTEKKAPATVAIKAVSS